MSPDPFMDLLLGSGVALAKMAVVLFVVLTMAAYMVLLERKLLGRMQLRYGPNRVGPLGLLQPLADGVKLLLKEDLASAGVDRLLFLAAPGLVAVPALIGFAVIPVGGDLELWGHRVPLVISDLNVGLLLILALSSVGVYGIALGGWASSNKFSLLGGVRGAAQMVSYELSLVLSVVPVVMLAKSLSIVDIVEAQSRVPFLVLQPLGFAIFFISALAESKRIPFDLPEAENELQAGFHTEYSGMRFGLFFVGEYVNMILLGALIAVFYLGGWHGPLLPGPLWLFIKVMIVPFVLIWTRATLPRLRYDQLMHLGWKVLVPLALANILLTGAFMAATGM